jgi:glycerate 2-kinase
VHVVVAPDKFKGSLTAVQVGEHVATGLHSVYPDLAIVALPMADGGDGTVDAVVAAGFDRVAVTASGPTGADGHTSYARRGDTAVVELATVCGLLRLPGGTLAPMSASSYGLGEVVDAAITAGARRVVLGLGGSASTDGGAGFLQGLGIRVRGREGGPLAPGGRALADVEALDVDAVLPRLRDIEFTVAGDVSNPLCGPNGAAAVYGPQKGADRSQVAELDAALSRWADLVADAVGRDLRDLPGAGAAGGVGFAAAAVLGARILPGIDLLLDLTGFRSLLSACRLVVTGEGAMDRQTLAGKAPVGVAAAARAAGVPTVAVCGRNSLNPAELADAGISAVYALADVQPDLDRCRAEAGPLLEQVAAVLATNHLS